MVRAVAHLHPAQIVHRARLRAKRHLFFDLDWSRTPVPRKVWGFYRRRSEHASWPSTFIPVDRMAPPEAATAEDLSTRRFNLVGETRDLAAGEWNPAGASQLWRYHLHYMEWAWALRDEPFAKDVFARLWDDWHRHTRLGRGDAWSPYVVSLRAWALCGLYEDLIRGTPIEEGVRESLEWHAGFVLNHLELDVGGNHLVKNVKALIGLGVFLGDDKLLQRGRQLLARELPVQVLPDGGHYERSPSYHAQVLADLIDMHGLLEAAGHPPLDGLDGAIERMRTWLAHMLMPDDTVPLLRDCVPVPPARLDALGIERLSDRPRMHHLADSGYVVVHVGRMHAVLDVGQPCPKRLPAHAQADSLNWVLHLDGQPFVVDTGTSSYQDPEIRAHERSTAAHNTVEIDGQNSTEVFGAFRAGRRARVTLLRAEDDGGSVTVEAEHDGYRFLDGHPVHRRRWIITEDAVRLSDRIEGKGAHAAAARIHHVPSAIGDIYTKPPGETSEAAFAEGMSARTPGLGCVVTTSGELPLGMSARITLPLRN